MEDLHEGVTPAGSTPAPPDTWCERALAQARELEALLDEAAATAPAFERQAIRLANGLVGAVIDQLSVPGRRAT